MGVRCFWAKGHHSQGAKASPTWRAASANTFPQDTTVLPTAPVFSLRNHPLARPQPPPCCSVRVCWPHVGLDEPPAIQSDLCFSHCGAKPPFTGRHSHTSTGLSVVRRRRTQIRLLCVGFGNVHLDRNAVFGYPTLAAVLSRVLFVWQPSVPVRDRERSKPPVQWSLKDIFCWSQQQ